MSYRRVFDAGGSDSLAKLARWVRPGAAVLELGAATGYFTAYLDSLGCTVDVVEIDAAAAAEARRHARRTVVADLETGGWVDELGGARYDAIVCADVIEHVRDGEALLARLRPLLADGGELLLSVPNVAHSAVIAGLLDERFEYGGEGLLDPTHVRLYTWRSLASALARAGYAIRAWDATVLAPFETEFRGRSEALDPALREALERRPHAFVYQWLVRVAPGSDAGPGVPPALESVAGVPVRLLFAADADSLTLDRVVTRWLPIGGASVVLEWTLPRPSAALRLLLADRIGVIEVRALALLGGDEVLWTAAAEGANVVLGPSTLRIGDNAFALTAPEAWIAPDVPAEVAARADRVSAVLAWPGGIADDGRYAVFAALAKAREAERAAARGRADELLEAVRARDARIEEGRTALAQSREERARLEGEIARLEAAAAAQERIIAYRQSIRWWLALPVLRARLLWRRIAGR